MKIVLASNNRGKLAELQSILAPLGVQLIAQGDLFAGEAPEPHCTFVENALAKARFAAEKTGLPAIADDAGLCLDAFGGLPGVQTAYYCTQFGYEKSDANNVQAVLEQLAQQPRSTGQSPRGHGQHLGGRAPCARPRAADRRRPGGD